MEEKKLQIYQTNDFDSIQNRLENFYDNKNYLENKLKKIIDKDNILYRETEYKLEQLNEEIKINEDNLNKCLNNLINN